MPQAYETDDVGLLFARKQHARASVMHAFGRIIIGVDLDNGINKSIELFKAVYCMKGSAVCIASVCL